MRRHYRKSAKRAKRHYRRHQSFFEALMTMLFGR